MTPVRRPPYRARRLSALALGLIVVVVLVVLLTSGSSPSVGYDISYPQCGGSYPSSPLFGIVGVNGGRADDTNSCFTSELGWAQGAPGQEQPPRPSQPALSFYTDTGNPGDTVPKWPKHGRAPSYGTCNGLLTNSCSYLYGEQRSAAAYHLAATVDPSAARTAPWWLDVELALSWAGTYQLNRAALQGYVAGLRNAGATGTVGVYSTRAQWQEITGLTAQTTTAAFNAELPDWVAGIGTTVAQARQACVSGGFTGSPPSLAQYRLGAFDADVRC